MGVFARHERPDALTDLLPQTRWVRLDCRAGGIRDGARCCSRLVAGAGMPVTQSAPMARQKVRHYPSVSGRLAVTLVVLCGAGLAAYAQTAKPPGALHIERVRGNLHMISGEGGNVAVAVTDEGVVLVDDMFDRNHADILAQVK